MTSKCHPFTNPAVVAKLPTGICGQLFNSIYADLRASREFSQTYLRICGYLGVQLFRLVLPAFVRRSFWVAVQYGKVTNLIDERRELNAEVFRCNKVAGFYTAHLQADKLAGILGVLVTTSLLILQAPDHVAYRAEITRISTMMYARDTSGATYPASGVRDGFHGASHHSNVRANMDRFALINKYHVQMLAYFLEKLRATPDGDGNLLDHSAILYGSSMSNGNQHDHDPLPIVVAGGASGTLKGGRHVTFPAHTPMSNLMLALLDKLGVHQDSFGDSTAKLEI